MISRKRAEQQEKRQLVLDAGPLTDRFPDVASIVVIMDYYRDGSGALFMHRTVNFFPASPAYFLMDCMADSCNDGGFDLEPIIYRMINGHQESAKGELACTGSEPVGHRRIDYKITIQYN